MTKTFCFSLTALMYRVENSLVSRLSQQSSAIHSAKSVADKCSCLPLVRCLSGNLRANACAASEATR